MSGKVFENTCKDSVPAGAVEDMESGARCRTDGLDVDLGLLRLGGMAGGVGASAAMLVMCVRGERVYRRGVDGF